MSLLRRLFSRADDAPELSFGRYTDAYKSPEQQAAWERAQAAYRDGDVLRSYRHFFEYLRDPTADNVQVEWQDDRLDFECYQGSKRIVGTATAAGVSAYAVVIALEKLTTDILQELLERNYALEHTRYGLDEAGRVTLYFDSYETDSAPHKLYRALRELAITADKLDDLLVARFESASPAFSGRIRRLPEPVRETQYAYVQSQIAEALALAQSDSGTLRQYAGPTAYLLLHTVYKLDYLITPEGFMLDALERINRTYFSGEPDGDGRTRLLVRELRALQSRPRAAFYEELYATTSTFGITKATSQSRLRDLIEGQLPDADWYLANGHHRTAVAITGYIVGYALFNFAPPRPVAELLHLYFEITENAYFYALGYHRRYYEAASGKLYKRRIRDRILQIRQQYRELHPTFRPEIDGLNYSSLAHFVYSYLVMVSHVVL